MCGEGLWAREDGRALATFVEELRLQARMVELSLAPQELPRASRDARDRVAVRPTGGGQRGVPIYGLLEARMTRADLVICAGLNEGVWPPATAPDPLLPPAVLRALGVPGAEFRIGLSAHDLAGLLGKSMLSLTATGLYAIHELFRQYAWARLEAALPAALEGSLRRVASFGGDTVFELLPGP